MPEWNGMSKANEMEWRHAFEPFFLKKWKWSVITFF